MNHYKETGQWKALLKVYETEPLPAHVDSISYACVDALAAQALAHEHLGNTFQALQLQKRIALLNDSLLVRELHSKALEVDTRYRTKEQQLLLAEKQAQSEARRIAIIALGTVVAVCCILVVITYRSARKTKRRNRLLVKKMEVLEACRDRLSKTQKELECCYIQLDEARKKRKEEALQPIELEKVPSSVDEKNKNVNRELFTKLEGLMQEEQLFKKSTLTRDDIAQMLHVNRNRLAEMLQQNVGMDLTTYLNQLRLNYVINHIKQQTGRTVQAIAAEAGFTSVRTLQRLFKEELDMTPSEYIRTLKEGK